MTRSKPNILVTGELNLPHPAVEPSKKLNFLSSKFTGTPGVGKSTLCNEVLKHVDLEVLDISKIAKTRNCLSGFDSEFNCPIIDEDKVNITD